MLYDYLEEFAAIARAGSLSAAASSVGLSQPALSRHLTALETQLATKLVARGPGGIQLTPEGCYALDTALDIAALEQSVERHFADPGLRRRERHIRTVALDAFPTVERLLMRACAELNASEGFDLELRRADSDIPHLPLAELLERRLIDAAAGFGGALACDLKREGCAVVTLIDVPGVAVLSPTHRFADRQQIELADLRSCHIVRKPSSRYEAAGSWEELRLACERTGFAPRVATRPPDGSWDLVPLDTDEVEIALQSSPEIGRRIAAGWRVLPVDGLSLPIAVALRAEDATALRVAERARSLASGAVRPIPISHQSMYGAPERDASPLSPNVNRAPSVANLSWSDDPGNRARVLARVADEPKVVQDLVLPDGTVVDKAYVALRNRLNRIGDGLSNDPVETSYQVIMRLWDLDEARAELEMPLLEWFTAYDFAASSGRDPTACSELLERMARKNLLFHVSRGGTDYYYLLGWVYGIWEFSVQHYGDEGFMGSGIYGSDAGSTSHYPIMHVCPVSREVVRGGTLVPYRDWEGYIARQTIACVAPCQCRRYREFEQVGRAAGAGRADGAGGAAAVPAAVPPDADRPATASQESYPIEVCLTFGEMAQYWIENGNGRQIPPDEALSIARDAVFTHGMVPQLYFSKNPEVVCFCRSQDCLVLSTVKATGGRASSFAEMSAYRLLYEPAACTGCGACAARCPMDAVMHDETGQYLASGTCVACGQCVLACKAGARILEAKDPAGIAPLPKDLLESYRWRSEDRMARGYISDFTAPRLDRPWGAAPW